MQQCRWQNLPRATSCFSLPVLLKKDTSVERKIWSGCNARESWGRQFPVTCRLGSSAARVTLSVDFTSKNIVFCFFSLMDFWERTTNSLIIQIYSAQSSWTFSRSCFINSLPWTVDTHYFKGVLQCSATSVMGSCPFPPGISMNSQVKEFNMPQTLAHVILVFAFPTCYL